jgi:hypothetical protein
LIEFVPYNHPLLRFISSSLTTFPHISAHQTPIIENLVATFSLTHKAYSLYSFTKKASFYHLLEGKDVGKRGLEGSMARLSKSCAEITLGGPVKILGNLKMNLKDADEQLSTRDFYAKVIERSGEDGQTYVVHFTSVPPEVSAYFQSHRQHAKPAAI